MTNGYRVLAIDDSLTIRKLLEMVLGRSGYQLELAASGEDGIARARSNPPDLILLDYVLPDMKGTDVCARLHAEERTNGLPIVMMSANGDAMRSTFASLPSVVETISKPFTPAEIAFVVSDTLAKSGHKLTTESSGTAGDASASTMADGPQLQLEREQVEQAARLLFGRLRERFARIPQWAGQLKDAAPSPYFARKILTAEVVEGIAGDLVRAFGAVASETKPSAVTMSNDLDGAALRGHTSVFSLPGLLRALHESARTGVLVLENGQRHTNLYLRGGEVVFATHNDPEEYGRGAELELRKDDPAYAAAQLEQRQSGKPVLLTLAEAGLIAGSVLPTLLHQQGMKVLLEAIDAGPSAFAFFERQALPSYVDAFGRLHSLEQVTLERLRRVDDWAQIELNVASLEVVFQREEGFSQRLERLGLTDAEKRILTLVDGRQNVHRIIDRSSLPTFEVFHVLFRMRHVGLIRQASDATTVSATTTPRERAVLIVDPDVDGVQTPLAKLLQKQKQPVPLLSLPASSDLLAAVIKERPRLVLLNVDTVGDAARRAVEEIRATLEVSDVLLVALLDRDNPAYAEELAASGFNGVLVKPFLAKDIDKLLAA